MAVHLRWIFSASSLLVANAKCVCPPTALLKPGPPAACSHTLPTALLGSPLAPPNISIGTVRRVKLFGPTSHSSTCHQSQIPTRASAFFVSCARQTAAVSLVCAPIQRPACWTSNSPRARL
jgi:hypothetical protein